MVVVVVVVSGSHRIHQGDGTSHYVKLVAGRFASLSEIGEVKLEAFAPTGGGTVSLITNHKMSPPEGESMVVVQELAKHDDLFLFIHPNS